MSFDSACFCKSAGRTSVHLPMSLSWSGHILSYTDPLYRPVFAEAPCDPLEWLLCTCDPQPPRHKTMDKWHKKKSFRARKGGNVGTQLEAFSLLRVEVATWGSTIVLRFEGSLEQGLRLLWQNTFTSPYARRCWEASQISEEDVLNTVDAETITMRGRIDTFPIPSDF